MCAGRTGDYSVCPFNAVPSMLDDRPPGRNSKMGLFPNWRQYGHVARFPFSPSALAILASVEKHSWRHRPFFPVRGNFLQKDFGPAVLAKLLSAGPSPPVTRRGIPNCMRRPEEF